ncbi:MAG: hypothetical protein JWM14_2092 [Chitinophagaceae bacterium]|nr:hypothetical protein [Chitinophagaceae bacterium]
MKKLSWLIKIILLFWVLLVHSIAVHAISLSVKSSHDMSTANDKEERTKVAKAILELHDLYISTGEEKKPMTISLPDLSEMAGLSEETTERVLSQLVEEKIISIEKSAIRILEKRKLKKMAG